jgi:hypothetical protein
MIPSLYIYSTTIITALKMYDRHHNSLVKSLIAGFEIRSVLNFLYGLGITPRDLNRMIEESKTEAVCPEMHDGC